MAKLTPRLPLYISETDGAYEMISDYVDLVRQNLKMLVFTNPGERLMDANFGVGLKRYLFQPSLDRSTESSIRGRIYSQIGTYMNYLAVNQIDVVVEDQKIDVRIFYSIVPLKISDMLSVNYEMK